MWIADTKRMLKILPHTMYFKQSLLFAILFSILSFTFASEAKDFSDLSLSVFYCAFPALMLGSQTMRTDFTTQFRTSAHRKGMLTKAVAVILFFLTMLGWGLLLAVYTFALRQNSLPDTTLFAVMITYLVMQFTFNLITVVQIKFQGVWLYVAMFAYILILFGIVFGFMRTATPERLMRISAASHITPLTATGIVAAGTFVIACCVYALLLATYRIPVNTRQLDKAKF